jgi:hypothetical protein
VTAVRNVARGEALLAPAITQRLIQRFVDRPPLDEAAPALAELSARELEVLGVAPLEHNWRTILLLSVPWRLNLGRLVDSPAERKLRRMRAR